MKQKTGRITRGLSLFIPLIIFSLSSCVTVGPDYTAPEMDAPDKWQAVSNENISTDKYDKSLSEWWKNFDDPILTGLINRAVTNNLSIKQAAVRLNQARIRRGISEADKYPSVTSSASARKSRTSNNSSKNYQAGLDSSWEIDLFGQIKRTLEAYDADIESAEDSLNDTLISLVAEVALNYVNLRLYQSELENTAASLKLREETFEIVSWRYEAGLVTELDLKSSESTLEQTRSQVPALQSSIDQAQNNIAVLLGCNPGTLKEELSPVKDVPALQDTTVKTGIPADILRQRPDLRKAERDLAAQTARIGVAKADLYPKITLSGSIGISAVNTGGLFESDNITRSIGPSISWPVFNYGSLKKNVEIQKAETEQLLLTYKSLVLNAFNEVENAISSCFYEQLKREPLEKAVKASERSLEIARMQYSSGIIDFQSLLENERSLLSLQNQLIQSKGQITINYINLYKALGGGWTSLSTDI